MKIKKIFKGKYFSFRYKLLLSYVVLVIFPIIINLLYYKVTYNIILNTESNNLLLKTNNITQEINDWVQDFEASIIELIYSNEVEELMKNDNEYSIEQNVTNKLNFYKITHNEVTDLAIYKEDDYFKALQGSIIKKSLKIKELKGSSVVGETFYNKVYQSPKGKLWLKDTIYKLKNKIFDNKIVFATVIREYSTLKNIGVFIAHIDSSIFEKYYNSYVNPKMQMIILDESNNIIFEHLEDKRINNTESLLKSLKIQEKYLTEYVDLPELYTVFLKGEKYLVYIDRCKTVNWKVVSFISIDVLIKNILFVRNIVFIFTFLLFILITIYGMLISNNFFYPIDRLRLLMRQVEDGDLSVTYSTKRKDEIGSLYNGFNMMLDKINRLLVEQEKNIKKEKELELKAIQAQIKPHFLYNTLDIALYFARESKQNQIVNILTSLINYYRISLNSGKFIVKIEEEINHIKNYLNIQMMKNYFDIIYDIDSTIYNKGIVKITLQPLVENAIIHGLISKKENGELIIKGRTYKNNIYIFVKDNGVGISKSRLKKLKNNLSASEDNNESYGVINVNSRLVLQYGKGYGLFYISRLGKGTTVVIKIPARDINEEGI